MEIRSRAPLRIGIAGGGTDVSPYSDQYGGCVFNATIGMYSYCTIIPTNDNKITFIATDRDEIVSFDSTNELPIGEPFLLHRGAYNKIVKNYNGNKPLSFKMITSSDAPGGSGLGTSSTMMVVILEAFNAWLKLHMDAYDMADLAYEIERIDLKLAGGKQDQYAAVFGGFNFMEFHEGRKVIVNPLRIPRDTINELECSMFLYFGGKSRDSASIIAEQINNTKNKKEKTIEAMHALKQSAYDMKDDVLSKDFEGFAEHLRIGWENKKKTSAVVSNQTIEQNIAYAMEHGAEAVKVSGAGGGGFILMYCKPINRQKLHTALNMLSGHVFPVKFSKSGVESWIIKNK